jgi:hypothetical protein
VANPIDGQNPAESVQAKIRSAFPDFVYSGPITSADGKTGEDYDETEALYNELYGKSWSEISVPFIRGYADGLFLLTVEAFAAYLPAWLIEGIADPQVGEVMVYTFCPEHGKDRQRMDSRMERLNSMQKEALSAFLAYCYQTNSSKYLRDCAEQALAYVRNFCDA